MPLIIIDEFILPTDRGKITITVDQLIEGYGDPVLICQVWVNLIKNAIKFTRKKEKPTIQIQSYQENNQTVYVIKDNGAGFNKEDQNKLFTIFQRLHTTSEFQGTGIGLSIVMVAESGQRESRVRERRFIFHYHLGWISKSKK